jgi:hypothetical protein
MYIFSVTSDTDYNAELYVQLDYDVVSSSNYFLLNVTNLQTNVSRAVVLTKDYANDRNTKFSFTFFAEDNEAKDRVVYQETSFFKYEIYEQTSSTNIDITDSSIVAKRETGKFWVGGESQVTYVKQAEANPTNSVYLKI